jgi:hypothetical protein
MVMTIIKVINKWSEVNTYMEKYVEYCSYRWKMINVHLPTTQIPSGALLSSPNIQIVTSWWKSLCTLDKMWNNTKCNLLSVYMKEETSMYIY